MNTNLFPEKIIHEA